MKHLIEIKAGETGGAYYLGIMKQVNETDYLEVIKRAINKVK